MTQDYTYILRTGDTLSVTTYDNDNLSNRPCLIFVHGFKGFKDWGFVPYTAEYLAKSGFFVITFNFSHNGIGPNGLEFTELEKFADNTFSREKEELNEIIDAYKNNFFGETNNDFIGLIGHSRGGGISILVAESNKNINAAVTWSAISNFDRFSDRQKKSWRNDGYFEVLNSRTKQVMRLNVSLLDDLDNNLEIGLNLEKSLKNLNKPLLIIHGEQDLAVPPSEAEKLYSWANTNCTRLLIIPNTGHTFDIKHPFEGSNDKFDEVLQETEIFFTEHLN
jgi:dienelactone hydrolase